MTSTRTKVLTFADVRRLLAKQNRERKARRERLIEGEALLWRDETQEFVERIGMS